MDCLVLEYMMQLDQWSRPSLHESGIIVTTRSDTSLWQSVTHIYFKYIAIVEEQLLYNPISPKALVNRYSRQLCWNILIDSIPKDIRKR